MLETQRLVIRKFVEKDADAIYEYLSLPETYRFEPGDPITINDARALAKDRATVEYFFAVVLKNTNTLIGHLYFNQIEPLEFMTWELGFIFNPKYQNNGYCTEASKKIIEYGFYALHAHRIIAHCNPMNPASWKVLEKAGMKREGHFKEKAFFRKDIDNNPQWHDCYAYGILK